MYLPLSGQYFDTHHTWSVCCSATSSEVVKIGVNARRNVTYAIGNTTWGFENVEKQ
ncbi:predicted protein [Sclerotinia sclerotiorum 1980 UF-70]|uniref:Uncharacterized protein n=1 Tax=Sclerotinia sclerotiorum (strain ATCC 18683 / 1980 / Ss-1) TaxID=665079 RepID=A7F7C4_SCLS1|nr:predicted protein [Sclerotinia sclerotiorum 1980 UF-70]EDN98645.1 predicted protein [Sclerotinia sclerotiorum 1980 UF-70]